jgi:hypothetical protein
MFAVLHGPCPKRRLVLCPRETKAAEVLDACDGLAPDAAVARAQQLLEGVEPLTVLEVVSVLRRRMVAGFQTSVQRSAGPPPPSETPTGKADTVASCCAVYLHAVWVSRDLARGFWDEPDVVRAVTWAASAHFVPTELLLRQVHAGLKCREVRAQCVATCRAANVAAMVVLHMGRCRTGFVVACRVLAALGAGAGTGTLPELHLPWTFSGEGVWLPAVTLPAEAKVLAAVCRRAVRAVAALLRAVSQPGAALATCALRLLAPGLTKAGARAVFSAERTAGLTAATDVAVTLECAICNEPGLDTRLVCRHEFHIQCLGTWFKHAPVTGNLWDFSCPVCRATV